MPDSLRWGLLSTARINRSLIPPLKASPRNHLLGVASRDAARAQAYADEWSIPRAYGSYEALLADPEIDVVYNALPNHLHAEWTVAAARAGKHVLCEKPLALTLAELDAIAVAAQDVVVAEAFMYRHHPRTHRLKAMIDEGVIGALQYIRGAFTFPLTRPADNPRWAPEMGGGSLWDVGCYPISFARYIVGAEPVAAYGDQVLGETGIDLSFAGQLRFPGDVLMQFDAGFRSPFRMEMTFLGADGYIDVPRAFKPDAASTLLLTRDGRTETITVPGPELLYLGEVEDLAAAVLDGTPPRVSLADSRGNAAAILALLTAARTGRPVSL